MLYLSSQEQQQRFDQLTAFFRGKTFIAVIYIIVTDTIGLSLVQSSKRRRVEIYVVLPEMCRSVGKWVYLIVRTNRHLGAICSYWNTNKYLIVQHHQLECLFNYFPPLFIYIESLKWLAMRISKLVTILEDYMSCSCSITPLPSLQGRDTQK